jgi:hypothetical protein
MSNEGDPLLADDTSEPPNYTGPRMATVNRPNTD